MKTHLVSSCFFHHSLEIFTAKIETAIPVKIPATDIRVADILEAHRLKQPFSKQEVQDRPKGAKDIPQKVVQLFQILAVLYRVKGVQVHFRLVLLLRVKRLLSLLRNFYDTMKS